MGRKMKKLTRAGAGALAGVMVFGLAAPLAPLSVEAADEVKNLAIGSTATVNDKETDYWGADKAVDGIVNRTAAKRDQSRWATNVGGDADAKWLKIDLKEAKTFQSFVLAWERRNITGYKIQISQTGEDNSWEDVYTKTGASHISHINENIHLPEAKTARYVRLYIDGYTANAADDQTNWRSVSLYDFQIYANEIPDTVLPDENYCLEGTAEASNFEEVQSEPGKQGPAKAIDGDLTTRWATESDGKGTTARTLTVKLPAAQWVEYVKIDWEMPASGVPTPKKYTIEAAEKEGGEFTVVHTNSEQVTKAEQIIKLDKPVWAKELKLNVTEYGAATGTWYNVSVAEFGAYAMKPESGVIDENATAKQIADKLAAPTVKADKTGLEWQDVPEGVTVEFLADYEQVVGRDGKIYQPLRETTVTITADASQVGQKFAGWQLKDKIVSYDEVYTFAISGNMAFTATYAPQEQTIEKPLYAAVADTMIIKRADGKANVKYIAKLSIPDNYILNETGLLWYGKPDLENLCTETGPTPGTKKIVAPVISSTYQFAVNVNGIPAGKTIRGVIYAKVTDKETQQTKWVYSEEVRLTNK